MGYRAKWRSRRLEDMTPEEHRKFAESLLDVEMHLRAKRPRGTAAKRQVTMAANLLEEIRVFLYENYSDAYLPTLDPDPEVWGDLIAGLNLEGV